MLLLLTIRSCWKQSQQVRMSCMVQSNLMTTVYIRRRSLYYQGCWTVSPSFSMVSLQNSLLDEVYTMFEAWFEGLMIIFQVFRVSQI